MKSVAAYDDRRHGVIPWERHEGRSPALVQRFGRRKVVTLGGVRIGMVHGDGHSHQPMCERRGEIWLVNPGSPTDKRTQIRYSYAILDIERARAMPRLVFFDRH